MALPPALAAVLPPSLPVRSAALLAPLWSAYGHIYRLTLTRAPGTLIAKLIQPPPSSPSASESHLRKLLSYRVERYFYTHLAAQLPPSARVARAYPVAATSALLLLEDLAPAFPAASGDPCLVLTWLANFHAAFWGAQHPGVTTATPDASGVWASGGYWYLATRRDEFAAVQRNPEYAFLCRAAVYAAAQLARRDLPGTTLLHGDCKSANVAFAPRACALYDFQYVGRGFGAQDVVYFLATSVARARLRGGGEDALWRVYYAELEAALDRRGVSAADAGYSWDVMREQADWALVDWMRFMAGWGCWGNARWVEERARAICARWEEEGRVECV